jgi:hypothetical protein
MMRNWGRGGGLGKPPKGDRWSVVESLMGQTVSSDQIAGVKRRGDVLMKMGYLSRALDIR